MHHSFKYTEASPSIGEHLRGWQYPLEKQYWCDVPGWAGTCLSTDTWVPSLEGKVMKAFEETEPIGQEVGEKGGDQERVSAELG